MHDWRRKRKTVPDELKAVVKPPPYCWVLRHGLNPSAAMISSMPCLHREWTGVDNLSVAPINKSFTSRSGLKVSCIPSLSSLLVLVLASLPDATAPQWSRHSLLCICFLTWPCKTIQWKTENTSTTGMVHEKYCFQMKYFSKSTCSCWVPSTSSSKTHSFTRQSQLAVWFIYHESINYLCKRNSHAS